ncbi:hypothetical protein GCM10010411_85450 [Actinomadura fulvescens]|uniref:Uncharacterized protein n=1 Tax=Actinomadura fulvescens TaxID=46160 RepID=A0ABN3QSS7_9ACTN
MIVIAARCPQVPDAAARTGFPGPARADVTALPSPACAAAIKAVPITAAAQAVDSLRIIGSPGSAPPAYGAR